MLLKRRKRGKGKLLGLQIVVGEEQRVAAGCRRDGLVIGSKEAAEMFTRQTFHEISLVYGSTHNCGL